MTDDAKEQAKAQLDYAWKWFAYHADQRMKMFNFMLIVFGVLCTAIVSLINKDSPARLDAYLCFLSGVLALAFAFLDGRNRYLVRLGEDVLVSLEKDYLFQRPNEDNGSSKQCTYPGILWRQEREDQQNSYEPKILAAARKGKHRFWIRGIALMF